MATSKSTTPDPPAESSPYATSPDDIGKPAGPEHDASFHAPDFYDPKTGERIGTEWDSEQQKNDPGIGAPPEDAGASGGESGEVTPAATKPTTESSS